MLSAALAAFTLQDPQVIEGVIVRPRWVEVPAVEQLTPGSGRGPTQTDYEPVGEVRLRCVVEHDGRLGNCLIVSQPAQYPELGDTALNASRHFRHADHLDSGEPSAGMPVVVKLRWSLSES